MGDGFCEIGGKAKKSRFFCFVEFALLEGSLHSLIVVVAPMKSTIAQGYCTDWQGLSQGLSQSLGPFQGQVIHPRKRFYFVSDHSPCHRRVVCGPGHGPYVDVVQWAA